MASAAGACLAHAEVFEPEGTIKAVDASAQTITVFRRPMKVQKALLLLMGSISCVALAADPSALVIPKITKPLIEAVENDPLQADYDNMWTEYEETVQKATGAIKEALDKQITKATDSGELELVEMWDGKRKRFVEKGVLDWDTGSKASIEWKKTNPKVPYPREFNEAVRGAASSVESAKQKLEEGYADLVKAYTKAKNVSRAKELRDEGAAVQAGNLPPAKSASVARGVAASSTSSDSDRQKESGRTQSLDAEPSTVEKKRLTKLGSGAEQASADLRCWQGEWLAVAGVSGGEALSQDELARLKRRLSVEGTTLTSERTRQGTADGASGSVTLDPNAHTFIFSGTKSSDSKQIRWIGRYRQTGDTLTLVYRDRLSPATKAPDFIDRAGSGDDEVTQYVYQRVLSHPLGDRRVGGE